MNSPQKQSAVNFKSTQFESNSSQTAQIETTINSLRASLASAVSHPSPYPNWFAENCLPEDILDECINLPFTAPDLSGVSGKRELHNKTRQYFDRENQKNYPACNAVTSAFQSKTITQLIEKTYHIDLNGSYLRVEYAQDTDGFWLEPHTDLGVKLFTMLLYISPEEQHKTLGTDYYDENKNHLGRSPFASNSAFIFIPSSISYHGFEKRKIEGVRKSIIINYVTQEWRAKEQLAYPNNPII